MQKKKYTRRTINARRLTLKKISWIFGKDLPFWGWYDCETDEIPVVIDNFCKQVWKAFREKSFAQFRKVIIREINHVILHEVLHALSQPANESEEMDMFPRDFNLTMQENLIIVEQKIDMLSLFMAGLIRTNRIACITLICRETLEELEEELEFTFGK